jgi:D-3-phosphoglycerate dehydrogenase
VKKIACVGTNIHFRQETLDELNRLGSFTHFNCIPSEDALVEIGRQNDVLITWGRVTRRFLDECSHLDGVVFLSTGMDECFADNQVRTDAEKSSTLFINTPSAGTIPVAEFCVAAALAALRKLLSPPPGSFGDWQSREFSEIQVGVVGLGAIGTKVGNYFDRLGMNVVCARVQKKTLGGGFPREVLLEELFSESDVIVVCLQLVEATTGIIDAELISKMKSNVIFINAARPEIVCSESLQAFMTKSLDARLIIDGDLDRIGGLQNLPNCIATPHVAFYSASSLYRYTDMACERVKALVR